MKTEYVPGPEDEYRGVIEIDCAEDLPEAARSKIRPTDFFPDAAIESLIDELDRSSLPRSDQVNDAKKAGDGAREVTLPPGMPKHRDDSSDPLAS